MTESQLSTLTGLSLTSQTLPESRSLRAMSPRFTRSFTPSVRTPLVSVPSWTAGWLGACSVWAAGIVSVVQERPYQTESGPAQAAWRHAPRTTGWLATSPVTPAVGTATGVVGRPPASGTARRAVPVWTSTFAESGPACWRTGAPLIEPRATGCGDRADHTLPVAPSRATQCPPTALSWRAAVVKPSLVITGSRNSVPPGATAKVARSPLVPEAAYTVPSAPTATTVSPPRTASGFCEGCSCSRVPTPARVSTRWAQTLPLAGSATATEPPRRSTTGWAVTPFCAVGAAGRVIWLESDRVAVLGLIGSSWLDALLIPRTAAPSWTTSRPELWVPGEAMPASSCPAGLLSRPNRACSALVTHTPPSKRSVLRTTSPSARSANQTRAVPSSSTRTVDTAPHRRARDTPLTMLVRPPVSTNGSSRAPPPALNPDQGDRHVPFDATLCPLRSVEDGRKRTRQRAVPHTAGEAGEIWPARTTVAIRQS